MRTLIIPDIHLGKDTRHHDCRAEKHRRPPDSAFISLICPAISTLRVDGWPLVSDSRTAFDSNTQNAHRLTASGACGQPRRLSSQAGRRTGRAGTASTRTAPRGRNPPSSWPPARNSLSPPPRRKRSERGPASGSEGVCSATVQGAGGLMGGKLRGRCGREAVAGGWECSSRMEEEISRFPIFYFIWQADRLKRPLKVVLRALLRPQLIALCLCPRLLRPLVPPPALQVLPLLRTACYIRPRFVAPVAR